MMKNLPNNYREVLKEISNMEGFLGIVDETNLVEDNILYGSLGLVFEDIRTLDTRKYLDLTQKLYLCTGDDLAEDPCYIYPAIMGIVENPDAFVSKSDLLKELEVE